MEKLFLTLIFAGLALAQPSTAQSQTLLTQELAACVDTARPALPEDGYSCVSTSLKVFQKAPGGWKDLQTGRLWSGIVNLVESQTHALKTCADLGMSLPTAADYSSAIENGLEEIYRNENDKGIYWTVSPFLKFIGYAQIVHFGYRSWLGKTIWDSFPASIGGLKVRCVK